MKNGQKLRLCQILIATLVHKGACYAIVKANLRYTCSVQKSVSVSRRERRGEHCSPADLTQQPFSGRGSHAKKLQGRTLCAPLQIFLFRFHERRCSRKHKCKVGKLLHRIEARFYILLACILKRLVLVQHRNFNS